MRLILTFLIALILLSCSTTIVKVPKTFVALKIKTSTGVELASYIKDTSSNAPVYIYIEGDGYAFDSMGQPTSDPTPRGTFLRQLAFDDVRRNVVYLARPCQYIMSNVCSQVDWTTGRYSSRNVKATIEAIQQVAKGRKVVLIGFSGGALMSGLSIVNGDLNVRKWITISGLLNHTKWTSYWKDEPLIDSLDLQILPNVKQVHIVSEKDKVVPKFIAEFMTNKEDLILLKGEPHTPNLDKIKRIVYGNNI